MELILELGEFLTKAFQIDGVNAIIEKKIMPLVYTFFKENKTSMRNPQGIIRLNSWNTSDVSLTVTKPTDADFSIKDIESMSSLELVLMELACLDSQVRSLLLEEVVLVFQDIILHGVRIEN